MMFRKACVALCLGIPGLFALPTADGQVPGIDLKALTSGETPVTTPGATPPPVIVSTSGIPEVDAALKRWDDLRDQMIQTQVDYKSAKPEDRQAILDKFAKLKADGEKFRPELVKVMEMGLKKDPKNAAVTNFIASYANSLFTADDYEEALRVAELLIAADYSNKRIYSLAGRAAFKSNDFEKAEKYFKIAQDSSALDGLADRESRLIPAYKPLWKKEQELRAAEAKLTGDQALPRVVLKTNEGDIVLELFENEAPQTVANFISLVEKKFYDGLTFHRVIPGFMMQGGDPKGDGTGGPEYKIPCECYKENRRLHFRGVISMAHSGKDTAGSQFFITFEPRAMLDGKAVNPENENAPHTVFGRVVSGLDVLSKIQRRDPSGGHGRSGPLPVPDKIVEAKVLNKRNHPYEPTKMAVPTPPSFTPPGITPPAPK